MDRLEPPGASWRPVHPDDRPYLSRVERGGLFDENAALVGLTTFYVSEGQNLNFALPVEWLRELHARHKAQTPTEDSTVGWRPKRWHCKAEGGKEQAVARSPTRRRPSSMAKRTIRARDLGIDLESGTEGERFKWFLACLLFGKPIQQEVAR